MYKVGQLDATISHGQIGPLHSHVASITTSSVIPYQFSPILW